MYKIFKKYVDLSNNSVNNYDEYKARETINDYYFSGIPYKINMYGNTPEISSCRLWGPWDESAGQVPPVKYGGSSTM